MAPVKWLESLFPNNTKIKILTNHISESDVVKHTDTNEQSFELQGLDIAGAIKAHRNWKVRLENYINDYPSEKLDPSILCKDNNCELGKWIYNHGELYASHLEIFHEIKILHAQFHIEAGRIVNLIDSGKKEQALEDLNHGEYVHYSSRLQIRLAYLLHLYNQVNDSK